MIVVSIIPPPQCSGIECTHNNTNQNQANNTHSPIEIPPPLRFEILSLLHRPNIALNSLLDVKLARCDTLLRQPRFVRQRQERRDNPCKWKDEADAEEEHLAMLSAKQHAQIAQRLVQTWGLPRAETVCAPPVLSQSWDGGGRHVDSRRAYRIQLVLRSELLFRLRYRQGVIRSHLVDLSLLPTAVVRPFARMVDAHRERTRGRTATGSTTLSRTQPCAFRQVRR